MGYNIEIGRVFLDTRDREPHVKKSSVTLSKILEMVPETSPIHGYLVELNNTAE